MALSDFIKALQQDDVVFSEPEKPSIRVIPPEKPQITVIPPDSYMQQPKEPEVKPKVIKFKLNFKNQNTSTQEQKTTIEDKPVVNEQPIQKTDVIEPKVEQPIEPKVEHQVVEQPVAYKEPTDEELFNNTGTEYSKKAIWMDYFNQAKNSRKKNPIVDRMKVGRFTITPDNKVLLLPDYDIVGKDPDDVLKDKWF